MLIIIEVIDYHGITGVFLFVPLLTKLFLMHHFGYGT